MKIDLLNAAACRSLRSAQTLRQALENFTWHVVQENTAYAYVIRQSGLNIRVCRAQLTPQQSGARIYTDLDFFIDVTLIIRAFSGKNWFPRCIAFQFWPPAGALGFYFPNTRFLFDQEKSWIELTRSLLNLPKQSSPYANGLGLGTCRLSPLARKDASAFIYALKRTLREHASDGFPDIEQAATIMCTSVRTLQRVLSNAGITYSKVLEYARFETAAEMLTNPKLKIIDIAFALGYEDPSHFSRAFRRTSGLSPRDFRLNRLLGTRPPKKLSGKKISSA
jgi:AraC-like DNA-binding protein